MTSATTPDVSECTHVMRTSVYKHGLQSKKTYVTVDVSSAMHGNFEHSRPGPLQGYTGVTDDIQNMHASHTANTYTSLHLPTGCA